MVFAIDDHLNSKKLSKKFEFKDIFIEGYKYSYYLRCGRKDIESNMKNGQKRRLLKIFVIGLTEVTWDGTEGWSGFLGGGEKFRSQKKYYFSHKLIAII